MRKNHKLHFTSEKQEKTKRFRAFIVAFIAFVLVLGSISTLIFMKSVNFDLQNLLKSPDDTRTTEESTTTEIQSVAIRDAAVLLVCCDTNNRLSLLSLVRADSAQNRIAVCALDTETVPATAQNTFQTVYEKNGMAGLENAVSSVYGIQIDRYVKLSEANLKKAISAIGDISVEIPAPISYRGADFSLYLDSGVQTLTGDLFVKFVSYTDLDGQNRATAALVQATLQSLSGTACEKQFNTLFNLSDSDFSVVDLTDTNGLVNVYVALRDTVTVASLPDVQ